MEKFTEPFLKWEDKKPKCDKLGENGALVGSFVIFCNILVHLNVVLVFLMVPIFVVGCSDKPKGDPQEILKKYIEANREIAYELLTDKLKSEVTKEDFVLKGKLLDQIRVKDSKPPNISFIKEIGEKYFGLKNYKHLNEYSVTYYFVDSKDNKEQKIVVNYYVLSENGIWKVQWDDLIGSVKDDIENLLVEIAHRYLYGEGKEKNILKAIEYSKWAINYYKEAGYNSVPAYQVLSNCYLESERYDEALTTINRAFEYSETLRSKSATLDNMACIYIRKNNLLEAQKVLNDAIRLDPDNEYAKDRLFKLEKMIKKVGN